MDRHGIGYRLHVSFENMLPRLEFRVKSPHRVGQFGAWARYKICGITCSLPLFISFFRLAPFVQRITLSWSLHIVG